MGFSKAGQRPQETEAVLEEAAPDLATLIRGLREVDPETRRISAKALSAFPQAVHALAGSLELERTKSVREVMLTSLALIGTPEAVAVLLPCLRSDDAHLRNEAIEVLKQLPTTLAPMMESLLKDQDPDVRIFAVNVLESLRHPRVVEWLLDVIENDSHVNVCATALDLLSEVGDESCISSLLRAQERFTSEPYLQFAVRTALDRIEQSKEST
ncbi:MAG: HEAT repeat domain-containing protein [Burkholderiales bacterium]|jgi:HEAT repeat protein|nr:HEAT repeat domain-containing protein [Burkholderiales bacterium]